MSGEVDKDAAEVMGLLHEADKLEYTPSEPIQADEERSCRA